MVDIWESGMKTCGDSAVIEQNQPLTEYIGFGTLDDNF